MTTPDRNLLVLLARRIVQLQGQVMWWSALVAVFAFFDALDDHGLDHWLDLLTCAIAIVVAVNARYARAQARAGIVDMLLRSLDEM